MSFPFGAATTQAPGAFGTQPAGSITFGTPVAQTGPRFGLSGSTFGQTTTPTATATTGFQLGATPNLFGSTATTTSAAPLFGTPAATKPLSFAAPTSSTAATAAPSLNFGAAAPLNFAAPAPASSAGFSLGAPPSASGAGLTFGTQTTQSGGGLFGSTSIPSTGLNFGSTPAATSAPSLALNFGSTSAAPTLSFGATSTPSTSINFSFANPATTATTTSTSLFAGLGGLKTTTTTSTTQSVGLGGITTQQPLTTTTKTEIAPKEQPLPNEIQQTVEQFKSFIRDQKTYSSEMSRCCVKEYWKMEESLEKLQKVVDGFEVELQKNRILAEKLKQDTAKGLQDADMAHRTFNTPPGMQYDNVEPSRFFIELADGFEKKVQELKRQIEATNSHLKFMVNPTPLTPEDLSLGMKRLHDSFIALAGGLQMVHNQVELQKEQYLNFRKCTLHDDKNVFAAQQKDITLVQRGVNYLPPRIEYGPTPFNSVTSNSFALNNLQNQPPGYPGTNPLSASSTTTPAFGGQSSSLFGSSTTMFGQPSLQFNSPSYNFQLQKPPVGNKRGKQ